MLDLDRETSPEVKWLSPSKVQTYVERCGLYLKNQMDWKQAGIPVPVTWSMIGGRAVHATIEWALTEVICGRKLPSGDDMRGRFPEFWQICVEKEEEAKTPITSDEDSVDEPTQVERECAALVPMVCDEFLVTLRPAFVERKLKERIDDGNGGSFTMWGVIDHQDESGELLDWKTTKEKVSTFQRKQDIQMDAYGWFDARVNGIVGPTKISKIFLIRGGGKPKIDRQDYTIFQYRRDFFERAAREVWRATQAGIYVPNTSSFFCAPRWCPFYGPCRGGM